MLIGQKEQFAIECQIEQITHQEVLWIFGRFRFWAKKDPIGDWEDVVDLRGCRHWMEDFVKYPQDRFEPELIGKSKEEIFHLLFDSFMPISNRLDTGRKPPFKGVETRFHISHLGMSSFDHFDVLLVESKGEQRILWRDAHDMEIKEAFLPPGEVQRLAKEFCEWFDEQETTEQHFT